MMKIMKNNSLKKQKYYTDLPLPSDNKIKVLAKLLVEQKAKDQLNYRYARTKDILSMIGSGVMLGLGIFVSPAALALAKPFIKKEYEKDFESWKQYNPSYLKRTLDRLRKEKLVTIEEQNGEKVVMLTRYGKHRILKYSLENLKIDKPSAWDGKWRLVMYDVSSKRKKLRDLFRQTLRSLGFYQLQESVWIYPFPCEDQIAFLREYYGVVNEVIYLIAQKLEDDSPYKTYFGIS